MDIYAKNFKPNGIALVVNNGLENKGVPMRCDHFIIVICKNGQAHRRLNHHQFPINQFSAHIIMPGQIHSFSNSSSDFEIIVLLFDRSYLAQFNLPATIFEKLLNYDQGCSPNIQLSKIEFNQWISNFRLINQELKGKEIYDKEIINSTIINLLYQFKRKLNYQANRQVHDSTKERILTRFKSHIEIHFLQLKRVKDYAAKLNITSKHLSETIKELTNKTALYHIHERLLHEAEYLLVYTDASISEIAFQLNFDTASHFGRFFKRNKQLSPKQFRLMNK